MFVPPAFRLPESLAAKTAAFKADPPSAPNRPGSIGATMAAAGGPTSGFDYMRIALALGVVAWHSMAIAYGREAIDDFLMGPLGPGVRLLVPMFFALSGFLVTQSLERTPSLKVFLTFRILRIFPALTVEVLLCAFLFGALFTALPLAEYFTSTGFWKYLLNMIGVVQYQLPGVFETHPVTAVNGSLWTVPFELECYVALSVLYVLGVLRYPVLIVVALVAGGIVVGVYSSLGGDNDALAFNFQAALNEPIRLRRILVLCFLAGSALFLFRRKIPYNGWIALAAFAASVVLLRYPAAFGFSPLFIAYVTVWLGLKTPPRSEILKSGDYSYGVYLYGSPIQQAVFGVVLAATGRAQTGLENLFMSLPLILLFAVFSWRVVEKPALSLKKRFIQAPAKSAASAVAPAGQPAN